MPYLLRFEESPEETELLLEDEGADELGGAERARAPRARGAISSRKG